MLFTLADIPHSSRNSVEMTFFLFIFVAIGGKMYARFAKMIADSSFHYFIAVGKPSKIYECLIMKVVIHCRNTGQDVCGP